MPIPFIHSTSGLGAFGGLSYTRLKGLLFSGAFGSTNAGPIDPPGGVALIQPALVCSTLGGSVQVLSTLPTAIVAANFMYIPQTTGAIFVSASTVGYADPPHTGVGAALLWDAGNKRLNVWSSVHGWVSQLSSVGGGYFTSS